MNVGECIANWGGLKSAIDRGPEGKVFRFVPLVLIPLAVLAGLTVFSRLGNFDFEAQKAIYIAGGDSWDFGNRSLWKFLYDYGTLPAAIISGIALLGYILSMFKERWKNWSQCCLFIILLAVVGPGIVSNLLLKEYWGRPRPRSVEELGGTYKFEPVLTIDNSSSGKSFPCGHATMGYFFIGGFFLLRRYHRSWAFFFLIFGLCLGFFMGVARMCQGGHFFSDVIWSGAIMYFVAMALYYDLKLFESIKRVPKDPPIWAKVGVPILGVLLLVGILLGTPYRNKRNYMPITEHGKTDPLEVVLTLKTGSIRIVPGDSFSIVGEAWGHGVPTSKVAVGFVEIEREGYTLIHYNERMSGQFTEVDQNLTVKLPWDRVRSLRLQLEDCHVNLKVPSTFDNQKSISVERGDGDLKIMTPKAFGWHDENDRDSFGSGEDPVNQGNPLIDIADDFEGKLSLERR